MRLGLLGGDGLGWGRLVGMGLGGVGWVWMEWARWVWIGLDGFVWVWMGRVGLGRFG